MENESRKSRNKTLQKVLLAVLSIILMTGIAFFMANVVHNNSSQPTSSKVENGLSAYELAVEQGYKGNLNDWLKSLDGKSAFEIAKENGYSGTEKEWNKAVANVSKQNKSVITNAGFNKNGDFILTLLDGTDVNVSNVSNSKGKDGTDGKNGTNGKNGANGKDGRSITLASVNSEGQLVITYSDGSSVNLDKLVGINGIDGVSISNSAINDKGELIITYSNGQICNLGKVVGVDGKNGINGINGSDGNNGKNGQDGISVVKSEINSNGELVVTYSNSVIDNLGKVIGSDGAKGEKGDKGDTGARGEKGEKGDAGEQGIQGVAGKDGKDGINGTNGVDGKDGTDGKDGVGINTVNITEDGKLNITLTNGTTLNLGTIKGEKGEKGDKGDTGRGIAKTELVNGELIITYTDGTKENLGSITSTENTADKYLVYKILTDDSVSVSLKSEYIGDLEGKITIPSEHNGRKVTEIKGFTGCQLSEIELPDTLEIIGPDTFSGCTNLKSITIPKNVYRIQGNAFLNSGLQTAKFENPSNWKKYQVYTYNGYDSTLTSVSSSSLSDETKAAELLTETYNYKNDSSISWKSGTYYFFKD